MREAEARRGIGQVRFKQRPCASFLFAARWSVGFAIAAADHSSPNGWPTQKSAHSSGEQRIPGDRVGRVSVAFVARREAGTTFVMDHNEGAIGMTSIRDDGAVEFRFFRPEVSD